MNVRKATIQDLIPVLNMQVSLREEVFGLKEYNENAIFLNLVGHLFNENSVLIVAEEGCLVTSFMLGWIQQDSTSEQEVGYAESIYIRKEDRAQGIMEALIQGFNDEFKIKGIKEVNFMAVPKTAKFWEKLGFETKATIFKKEVS